MKPSVRSPRRIRRFDLFALLLAPLGVGMIVLAQLLDGSPLGGLLQGTSALIVFGGTLGAVLISYTPREVVKAVRAAAAAFAPADDNLDALAATMVTLSIRAHRRGLPLLEQEVDDIDDPFLREGLGLVVDGVSIETLTQLLTLEKKQREAEDEAPARIFEAAAGYAPTMGILGAVLGLMRVMEHLGTPGVLGTGIALAFVATVYGVGVANLVLLPLAGRIRERAAMQARRRELIAHALYALHERMNPRLLAQKLRAFSGRVPRIDELAARAPAPARRSGIPA